MPHPLVTTLRSRFAPRANVANAQAMAAYMKTDMPFYGIKADQRRAIVKEILKSHPIDSLEEYAASIDALWREPHREMKYSAVQVARSKKKFITMESMPLYRRLIIEGGWWDFVDEVSDHLVGRVVLLERTKAAPIMRRWIDDEKHMWLRRAAIICQLKHKKETDEAMLFDFCLRRAHETEFFIRKAIGWALRQHAYTNPKSVRAFLKQHRAKFSGLTLREAGKHL